MKNKMIAVVMTALLFTGCSAPASASESVVDTTKPVITVSKKELNVSVGDKEWAKSVSTNFKVVDDIDGNLKEVEKIEEGKAGYVVDDDKVDPTKAGTYTVSITAVDSSGNTAKSSFSVKVTVDKEEAETESVETENTESKSESSSSSSAASSNSGSSSSASKPSTNSGSSSGSSTSSNTSKPSTGSSASSGSSSASKPSGGSASSGANTTDKPSSGNSGSTGTTATPPAQKPAEKPADPTPVVCDHTWVEVIQTIHHDAVPEVTHEEPVYETRLEEFQKCAYCGFTSDIHEVISNHCAYCGEEVISPINGGIIKSGSNWYSVYETYQVQTGTQTVVDKAGTPAYDETVVIGHRCSKCGLEQ